MRNSRYGNKPRKDIKPVPSLSYSRLLNESATNSSFDADTSREQLHNGAQTTTPRQRVQSAPRGLVDEFEGVHGESVPGASGGSMKRLVLTPDRRTSDGSFSALASKIEAKMVQRTRTAAAREPLSPLQSNTAGSQVVAPSSALPTIALKRRVRFAAGTAIMQYTHFHKSSPAARLATPVQKRHTQRTILRKAAPTALTSTSSIMLKGDCSDIQSPIEYGDTPPEAPSVGTRVSTPFRSRSAPTDDLLDSEAQPPEGPLSDSIGEVDVLEIAGLAYGDQLFNARATAPVTSGTDQVRDRVGAEVEQSGSKNANEFAVVMLGAPHGVTTLDESQAMSPKPVVLEQSEQIQPETDANQDSDSVESSTHLSYSTIGGIEVVQPSKQWLLDFTSARKDNQQLGEHADDHLKGSLGRRSAGICLAPPSLLMLDTSMVQSKPIPAGGLTSKQNRILRLQLKFQASADGIPMDESTRRLSQLLLERRQIRDDAIRTVFDGRSLEWPSDCTLADAPALVKQRQQQFFRKWKEVGASVAKAGHKRTRSDRT